MIGAGGHARVVLELLESIGRHCVGLVAPTETISVLGYPVLGSDHSLPSLRQQGIQFGVVAIGDNQLRRKCANLLRVHGFRSTPLIHPTSFVSSNARVGLGTVVMPNANICSGAILGDHVIVNTAAIVDHDTVVGDFAHVAPGVSVAGGCSIGEGALLGVGSSVVPERRIGTWATVAAGAVVTCDVDSDQMVGGVPARSLRSTES